ncbi:MAG: hypothetical protein LBQ28_07875 [Prevotellaceae bacterium]|jgi:hypothetical protein|nr:hypothetical protein [Prevotellaceae bacterium]
MKTMNNFLAIIICCITSNCSDIKKDKINSINNKNELYEVQTDEKIKILNTNPINVKEVKDRFKEFTTSTILNNTQTSIYYKPDTVGYYGRYYIVEKKEDKYSIIGTLSIFNSDRIWDYDNISDIFVEIVINGNSLCVYSSIHIGVNKSVLVKMLGNPLKKTKDHYIYVNDKTIAIFKIIDEKVVWIKIGRYNDDVIENINENIYELINKNN